jgi:DegV family protein with EDD domain
MAGVRIVTDSASDLTEDEERQHDIEVVPLTIRFGSDEYEDRRELSVERFYELMAGSQELPETAAPSPGKFEGAFRRQAEAGADAIVCITLSGALSATLQSAQNAARAFEGELDVRVVDSRSITSGLGTLVVAAAEAAAAGRDADDVVALVEDLSDRTRIFGTLDTLDNLKKGGRVGGAQALLGSLLSIKPVVDLSDGVVEEAGKARTRRKALEQVRDKVFAQPSVEYLSITHGLAPDVEEMLDLLAPRYERSEIQIRTIGPVIGTHGGPRVMGVTWVNPR